MILPTVPVLEIVLRTIVVYVVVIVLLHAAGKRELGQMSVSDFVVVLVIANAVQSSMSGGDTSLIGGLVAAATLVALNLLLDRYGERLPLFSRFVIDEPTLLVRDGRLLQANMRREHVSLQDIEMCAREHGIADLADIKAAILEPDGSISVITRTERPRHVTRFLRQFRHRS